MSGSPHKMLRVSPRADSEVAKRAYFAQAWPCHPLLSAPGDTKAASRFRSLSEAYWQIAVGSLEGFSMEALQRLWMSEFVFQEPEIPNVAVQALQMTTLEEGRERHLEASLLAKGPILGERLQCKICGFQVRSHREMRSHFFTKHEEDAMVWANGAVRAASSGLLETVTSFALEASDLDASTSEPGRGSFHVPDGAVVRPKAMPQVTLPIEPRPVSDEAAEVVGYLRATQPGLAAYLAPASGLVEPDLLAPLRYSAAADGNHRSFC